MNNLITIQAYKRKNLKGYTETVFLKDGKLFAFIPAYQRQPSTRRKVITLNCCKWAIEWIKPPTQP